MSVGAHQGCVSWVAPNGQVRSTASSSLRLSSSPAFAFPSSCCRVSFRAFLRIANSPRATCAPPPSLLRNFWHSFLMPAPRYGAISSCRIHATAVCEFALRGDLTVRWLELVQLEQREREEGGEGQRETA